MNFAKTRIRKLLLIGCFGVGHCFAESSSLEDPDVDGQSGNTTNDYASVLDGGVATVGFVDLSIAGGIGLNIGGGLHSTLGPNFYTDELGPEIGYHLGTHGAILRLGVRSSYAQVGGFGFGWLEQTSWWGDNYQGIYFDTEYILHFRMTAIQNEDDRRVQFTLGLRVDVVGF